jgi:hypothetical protein
MPPGIDDPWYMRNYRRLRIASPALMFAVILFLAGITIEVLASGFFSRL